MPFEPDTIRFVCRGNWGSEKLDRKTATVSNDVVQRNELWNSKNVFSGFRFSGPIDLNSHSGKAHLASVSSMAYSQYFLEHCCGTTTPLRSRSLHLHILPLIDPLSAELLFVMVPLRSESLCLFFYRDISWERLKLPLHIRLLALAHVNRAPRRF